MLQLLAITSLFVSKKRVRVRREQSPTDSEWENELRADGLRGRDGRESGEHRELR